MNSEDGLRPRKKIVAPKEFIAESYIFDCDGAAVDFDITKNSIILRHEYEGKKRGIVFAKKDSNKIATLLRTIANEMEH